MINITLDNGMVHTFRRACGGVGTGAGTGAMVQDDAIALWESQIELVQGYAHNGAPFYDLPDWKKAVIEQYPEDVQEAVTQYAVAMGIKL